MAERSLSQSFSVWMSEEMPKFPTLAGDIDASREVCVVGAGISGLTTAYLLLLAGQRVIVLDQRSIGSGETRRTTAHLTAALDDRYFTLERAHGVSTAKLAAESHSAAIDQIEAIIAAEEIECEFERVDGYLFTPPGESAEILDRELEAAHRAGLSAVERVGRAPLGSFDTGPALRFPRQAQFHPMKYLSGLAGAITRLGGRIYTTTHAEHIEGGASARITTSLGEVIDPAAVVVATNTPVNDIVTIHTKQSAYRTYAIGARLSRGSVHRALYWTTADPYHYARVADEDRTDGDLLIVGGEDHKTGQEESTDDRYARLIDWMRERFPVAGEVVYRWSGQVMETVDGLAFIGRNPGDEPNVFIATGDSGNGMTHGTIAGMLLCDLIQGKRNPWSEIYDPARLAFGRAFATENLNVAAKLIGDHLSAGDVDSIDDIPPASGAILRRGLKKIAAYRDEHGALHEYSAVCPHLGCIVHWNVSERTWDCPCHGSRFDPHGEILNGPAVHPLSPAEGIE